MPELPRTADIVIVGAGAIGCSIAYHLAKRGCRDVVVLERAAIGAGSTSRAAGGIRCQWGHRVEIEFSLASLAFFDRFEDEMGVPCDFRRNGYLFLLMTEAQLTQARCDVELQRSFGVETHLLAPDDISQIVPEVRVDDVLGATWGPNDGFAGPN